jgi:hypothetical protein
LQSRNFILVVGHVLHDLTNSREDPDLLVLVCLECEVILLVPAVADLCYLLKGFLLVLSFVDDFVCLILLFMDFSIVHILESNVFVSSLVVDVMLRGCNCFVDFVPV